MCRALRGAANSVYTICSLLVATSVYLAAQSPRGTRVFDLPTASIADINAAFGAGALTSEKLMHLYLTRIAAYGKQGPKLNALLILSNMTGWPDLTVPAGFTSNPALPVGLSFLGPAFSEATLLAIGAEFERVMPVRRLPVATPQLPGERFEY